jgi:dienelactone hydrolase
MHILLTCAAIAASIGLLTQRGIDARVQEIEPWVGPAAIQDAPPAQLKSIVGQWEGTLDIPGAAMSIQVSIAQAEGGPLHCLISVPSQGLKDYRLDDIVFSPPEITVVAPDILGGPTFKGRLEGNAIKGNLTQDGQSFPLELKRVGGASPAVVAAAAAQDAQPVTVAGQWEGTLNIPGAALSIQVNLTQAESGPLQGHISIPAQGLREYKLDGIAFSAPEITFRMPNIPGNPTFKGRLEGSSIKGECSQAGFPAPFPFELKRVGDAKPIQAEAALPKGLREKDIMVGSSPWELPGTLTLPAGKGPFPAVVLVHGSGPHDRDERIGSSAPFRDIAWGLAQKGIAVLRYDKRTFVHGAKFAALKNFTLNDETVDDAVLAAATARRAEEINPGKVFVVGHSQGGLALGRIAEKDPRAAGFISLAGPARPLEDLILEQVTDRGTESMKKAVAEAVAKVKSKDLAADAPASEMPLGIPASYWLDLRGYDPVASLAKSKRPALILQGEADIQVTMKDFAI